MPIKNASGPSNVLTPESLSLLKALGMTLALTLGGAAYMGIVYGGILAGEEVKCAVADETGSEGFGVVAGVTTILTVVTAPALIPLGCYSAFFKKKEEAQLSGKFSVADNTPLLDQEKSLNY